jgi:hypothetical protein
MHLYADTHLTYCTNIHPGETWPQVLASLRAHVPAVKAQVAPDRPFGLGLRLSDGASRDLADPAALAELKQWLAQHDCYVALINGFPYGGFHGVRVKDQVHQPDWTTRERLDYTRRLFRVLAPLLPAGLDGGVSTSPLSYKPWRARTGAGPANLTDFWLVYEQAAAHLAVVAEDLHRTYLRTGQWLHLDIEPEPDGLLENTEDTLYAFQEWIIPAAAKRLAASFGLAGAEAERAARQHLQLCYDICHFAVAYEDHARALNQFDAAGLRIGRFQVSAALRADFAAGVAGELLAELRQFDEPTYLHQVVARLASGQLVQYPDLGAALAQASAVPAQEWRTHFHVPIFVQHYQHLQSTQADIAEVLKLQKLQPRTRHLEVETYTWDVLPAGLRLGLAESIGRELAWVVGQY